MGNFLKSMLPYAAGALTGGVMGQFGATAPFAAAGSAAAGALTNKNRLQGALQGFTGGGIGETIGGGLKSMSAGQGFGAGAMSGLKSYGNSIPGFGGVGTDNPTGVFAKWLTPSAMQGTNSMTKAPTSLANATAAFGGGTSPNDAGLFTPNNLTVGPAVNTTAATGAPSSVVTPTNMVKNSIIPGAANATKGIDWPGMAGGAGVSMLGSMFSPKVAAADYSSVTGPLKDRINNPSANMQAVQKTYLDTINAPLGQDATAANAIAQRNSDVQKAQDLKNLQQQFAAANPGGDMTNNSAYQDAVAKMQSQYNMNDQARNAQVQFQYDQQQKTQQMAAANALSQLDDAQVAALAQMATYDIATIQQQTGMDVASAQQIQQLAATAGQYMMQKAAGLNQVQTPVKVA